MIAPPATDATRLRELLDVLGWSQRELARRLDCDDRLTRRWARDDGPVPATVMAWLEGLAPLYAERNAIQARIDSFEEKNPAPQDWRKRVVAA